MSDHCLGCGKPLLQCPQRGVRLACCGVGYWTQRKPEPRDNWFGYLLIKHHRGGVPNLWYGYPNLPKLREKGFAIRRPI